MSEHVVLLVILPSNPEECGDTADGLHFVYCGIPLGASHICRASSLEDKSAAFKAKLGVAFSGSRITYLRPHCPTF